MVWRVPPHEPCSWGGEPPAGWWRGKWMSSMRRSPLPLPHASHGSPPIEDDGEELEAASPRDDGEYDQQQREGEGEQVAEAGEQGRRGGEREVGVDGPHLAERDGMEQAAAGVDDGGDAGRGGA